MTLCACAKSVKEPTVRCIHPALKGSEFCGVHGKGKCKNVISQPSAVSSLLDAQPSHILREIGTYLDPKSLVALSGTSHRMKKQMQEPLQVHRVLKQKQEKQLQEFLKLRYIEIPSVFDEETDKAIFNWIIPDKPEVDSSVFDINQKILLNRGQVTVLLDSEGKGEALEVIFKGPVTLKQLVDAVNKKYKQRMKQVGTDDISDIVGGYVYPGGLHQIKGQTNIYALSCG